MIDFSKSGGYQCDNLKPIGNPEIAKVIVGFTEKTIDYLESLEKYVKLFRKNIETEAKLFDDYVNELNQDSIDLLAKSIELWEYKLQKEFFDMSKDIYVLVQKNIVSMECLFFLTEECVNRSKFILGLTTATFFKTSEDPVKLLEIIESQIQATIKKLSMLERYGTETIDKEKAQMN